jgi:hypothetical protein
MKANRVRQRGNCFLASNKKIPMPDLPGMCPGWLSFKFQVKTKVCLRGWLSLARRVLDAGRQGRPQLVNKSTPQPCASAGPSPPSASSVQRGVTSFNMSFVSRAAEQGSET